MLIMAMKMCAMIQLEVRQANVEANIANVEGEVSDGSRRWRRRSP
jgi:hypothetical protein